MQGDWSKIDARNGPNDNFRILRHALVMWSLQLVLLPVGIVLPLSLELPTIKGCCMCSKKCILLPFTYRRYPGSLGTIQKDKFNLNTCFEEPSVQFEVSCQPHGEKLLESI